MSLEDGTRLVWVINKVTDSKDETIDKYVDRKRVGQRVKNLYPLKVGVPLHLYYFEGAKSGGTIQHSRIVSVETTADGCKVYTQNTMVHLIRDTI